MVLQKNCTPLISSRLFDGRKYPAWKKSSTIDVDFSWVSFVSSSTRLKAMLTSISSSTAVTNTVGATMKDKNSMMNAKAIKRYVPSLNIKISGMYVAR